MRRLFTTKEAYARGLTHAALTWGERTGRWRRITRGVYGVGPEPPSALDRARARVIARTDGVARGTLAGVLHELDGVILGSDAAIRRLVPPSAVVAIGGVPCLDGLTTLLDLAQHVTDDVWEQALECAVRRDLATIAAIERATDPLVSRARGVARVRRVLALRPRGAPATGSILETCMVQLARRIPALPAPERQLGITSTNGTFIAFVDLSWPEIGLFLELDGQQHAGQPVYDAHRETAVAAATGWLCGRFTYHEVMYLPTSTARQLAALVEQCRRRPITHATRRGGANRATPNQRENTVPGGFSIDSVILGAAAPTSRRRSRGD